MRERMLPDGLGDTFTTRQARLLGARDGVIRGGDLERPFHGVRARRVASDAQGSAGERQRRAIVRAASQYAVRMSAHEFFSHSTAALLWGVPLPLLDCEALHVSVFDPRRLPRGKGVRGHQTQARLASIVRHRRTGLLLTSPATTWAMLGAELMDPYDLVAAGDAFVRRPRMPGGFTRRMPAALATLAQLEAATAAGRRVGRPALREALPLIRTGSSSRPETWMRLILVDALLPEPVLDHDVYDDAGAFLGCLDAAYPEVKVGVEYEGDQHRTSFAQWNSDIDRHERLAVAGWRIIRVSRDHVFVAPGELVRRVRAAL